MAIVLFISKFHCLVMQSGKIYVAEKPMCD